MADLWHYTSEGKRMEPVTAGELQQLAGAGFLRPEDLVWTQGMSDWAAASSISGLFPQNDGSAFAPVAGAGADASMAEFEMTHTLQRRRPAREDADDEPRSRPPRRRVRESRGPSTGLILGVLGGGVFLLLVVGVVLAIALSRRSATSFPEFRATIPPDGSESKDYFFRANSAYEFVLTSDPVSDVDIFLTDLNGQTLRSGNFVAADETDGPNGKIVWIFPADGMYRVKIHNLGPMGNTSTVTIRELGPGHAIEVPAAFPANPPIIPPIVMPAPKFEPKVPLPPPGPPRPVGPPMGLPDGRQQRKLPTLASGQECEFTVSYPVARLVKIEVTTTERDPDVDLFVFEVGGPRRFADESIGPDCRIGFQAQAGRSYRFVVRNVTPNPSIANSTITYTAP
jgi:GYF domain 2